MIAAPRFVGRVVMELNALHGSRLGEVSPHLALLIDRGNINSENLRLGQDRCHLYERRHNSVVTARKTLTLGMGPGDPGRVMRLPLRRHPVPEREGRGGLIRHNLFLEN